MKSWLVGRAWLGGRGGLSLAPVLLVCAGLCACAAEDEPGDSGGNTGGYTTQTDYVIGEKFDANGDGVLDTVVDSNGDRVADGVDVNGDLIKDVELPATRPMPGGATNGSNTSGTQGTGTSGSDNNATGTTGTTSGTGSSGTSGSMTAGDVTSTPGHDSNAAVSCGGSAGMEIPCDLKAESCCVTGFASDAAKCASGSTCSKGNRAQCDGPEDCGSGKVCCVDIVAGTTACLAGATCPLSAPFQMCHTDKQCPAGQKCKADSTFKWWGNCG